MANSASKPLFKVIRLKGRIAHALMLRYMVMRYGRENIGFAWTLIEPMLLTAGVMVVWTYTIGSIKNGITLIDFILTGYMPLTLWRHMTGAMVRPISRSTSILYHRHISLVDVVTARLLLEFIGASAAFLVVWGALNIVGLASNIARVDLVIVGWLLLAWLSAAIGTLIAVMTERSEASEKFIQPVQYLLIPVSGAFAMVDWVPTWAQKALLINPTVHCYEVLRAGYFGAAYATHFSILYVVACSAVLSFLALESLARVRSRLEIM